MFFGMQPALGVFLIPSLSRRCAVTSCCWLISWLLPCWWPTELRTLRISLQILHRCQADSALYSGTDCVLVFCQCPSTVAELRVAYQARLRKSHDTEDWVVWSFRNTLNHFEYVLSEQSAGGRLTRPRTKVLDLSWTWLKNSPRLFELNRSLDIWIFKGLLTLVVLCFPWRNQARAFRWMWGPVFFLKSSTSHRQGPLQVPNQCRMPGRLPCGLSKNNNVMV